MGRLGTVAAIARGIVRGDAHRGVCPICGPTVFVETGPWLRDQYRCARCLSIPRWRALIAVLDTACPGWAEGDVLEPAPGGAASRHIRRRVGRGRGSYTPTHYRPGVPSGAVVGGVRTEDIEALSFPDDTFDLVVTQDVFEHVLDPERGFAEIARVLRPRGLHVWTVPYREDRPESKPRARRGEDGEVVLLAEPEYHNDPVDPQGALVTTDWGADMPELIRQWTGMDTDIVCDHDRSRGLAGEFLEVFVTRR